MNSSLKQLIVTLLNDDQGVNEEAYYLIKEVVYEEFGRAAQTELVECVDATDGRFYFGSTIPSFLQ
jgi:hypothetical protein